MIQTTETDRQDPKTLEKTLETRESVQDYYGKILKSKQDLQTSACCTAEAVAPAHREILKQIHPDILDRFYGCGSPIPPALEGCTVLDLGCGTGRDAYLLSQLVGPSGRVIGVDMTDEQLALARKHQDYQAKAFGFSKSNVEFKKGFIEDLESLGIASNSVDAVISNCVINLSPDKRRVFSEIFRVLKPGGELYFSDVFSDKRIPAALMRDPVLLGECLAGALYTQDFRRMLRDFGCLDYRVVSRAPLTITKPDIFNRIGMIEFSSLTIRAFKLDVEDVCEDFGQVGYYRGTIPGAPHQWALDDHHLFKTGLPMLICSNTAAMIGKTRFKSHFEVRGDLSTHYGLFNCGPPPSLTSGAPQTGGCC